MRANHINKIVKPSAGAAVLALALSASVQAQNVGIGFSNPASKLAVNGNLAIGADYNSAAPTNGVLVEGNVGIGTTSPIVPLQVASTANVTYNGEWSGFNYTNTVLQHTPGQSATTQISAVFASQVFSTFSFIGFSGTLTASDIRLKNVIGRSDSAQDLETLKKIEVTDYTMKDTVTFGSKPFKKAIAQQVEDVYPTAVKSVGAKGITFTPDIYEMSSSVKSEKPNLSTIELPKAHGLKDGDTVRLVTKNNHDIKVAVHVVNDTVFSVETKEPLGDKVFVYGKECTDLKAIDYDAISMLNVSATQELAKKVKSLETENRRLSTIEQGEEQRIAALETANAKLTAMAAEMQAIKKAMVAIQERDNGWVESVVAKQ